MQANESDRTVIEIVAKVSKRQPECVKPEHQLAADLGIDSPKALELLCDLEDKLSIELPEDAVTKVETVGDLLDLVPRCAPSQR